VIVTQTWENGPFGAAQVAGSLRLVVIAPVTVGSVELLVLPLPHRISRKAVDKLTARMVIAKCLRLVRFSTVLFRL
jgi:hypothetical protein